MARKWIPVAVALAVCLLVGIGLMSCEKGKPLSELGPAKYVGSDKCSECHSRIAVTFRNTLHQKVMQDAKKNPRAIQGDFVDPDPLVDFKPQDVSSRTESSGSSAISTRIGGLA